MSEDAANSDAENLREVCLLLREAALAWFCRPQAACALIIAGYSILENDLGPEAAALLVGDTIDEVAAEIRAAVGAGTRH